MARWIEGAEALNLPSLAPGGWVAFLWKQERLWIAMWQNCSCAQTPGSWWWWQAADLRDRRKIMSLWWHIQHTCLAAVGLTRRHARTRAQTHKFLMSSRRSVAPRFTKAATDRPIWSAQPPHPTSPPLLHLLLTLLPGIHQHTQLPTGIKAYINSRGPDTMNPNHNSHTRGSSAVQQDRANAVLIKAW